MATWKLIDDNSAQENWDLWLRSLNEDCLYQTYAWGLHKQKAGQIQTRLVFFNDANQPQVMLQGQLKRMPFGIVVLWVPGGPSGNLELMDRKAVVDISQLLGAKKLLIRASMMRERDAKDVSTLRRLGHLEAGKTINSGLSMWLKLPDVSIEPLRDASSNWKHNLRRGQKRASVEQIFKPDPHEIAETYKNLQEVKKIGEQFSESAIQAMIDAFGSNLKVMGSRDVNGKLIAMRACICVNGKGWDIWAAATEDARKNYTSHLLLEHLLIECQKEGLSSYDLSGIDPTRAVGVYNFKKGTGAKHLEYLGEWDMGSQNLARLLDWYLTVKTRLNF